MILYKEKNLQIVAEKQITGLFTIYQKTKQIFGNSWGYIILKDGLTKNQVLQIKQNINNL